MRLSIILLLALFCFAQLAESGARKRKMKKLAKQIENLQEDIECLMDDMKKCKSELKKLDEKLAKMLTCLYKKDPKAVCTFFPGESFPAGDGCNVCTCGRDGGFPMCSLRPVPCNSNDGCLHNGCHYKVGEPTPPADGCNICSCAGNNLQRCTRIFCPPDKWCPATFPIPLHRPGSIVRQCNSTGDCPDGICCAKDCHHVCVDLVPSIRPCGGGAVQVRPDGTLVKCDFGYCPAPIGYCDTSTNTCCR